MQKNVKQEKYVNSAGNRATPKGSARRDGAFTVRGKAMNDLIVTNT